MHWTLWILLWLVIGLIFLILGSIMERETISFKDILISFLLGAIMIIFFIIYAFINLIELLKTPKSKRFFNKTILDFRKIDIIEEEEEEDFDSGLLEMARMLTNSGDTTLMLNLVTPYLIEREKQLKPIHRDILEVLRMLIVNQMKLTNDFRALLLYLNKRDMLDMEDDDAPQFTSVDNDHLYM